MESAKISEYISGKVFSVIGQRATADEASWEARIPTLVPPATANHSGASRSRKLLRWELVAIGHRIIKTQRSQ
jgi:hypothetical protein